MDKSADLEKMTILLPEQCALVLGGMPSGNAGPRGPLTWPPAGIPNLPVPAPWRPTPVPAPQPIPPPIPMPFPWPFPPMPHPMPLPFPIPLPFPRPLPPTDAQYF
jgi:hypothetical protein